jgi:hypothetical protein
MFLRAPPLSPEVQAILTRDERRKQVELEASWQQREWELQEQQARLNPPPPKPSPPRCTITRDRGIETVALDCGRGPRMLHGIATTGYLRNGARFRPQGCIVQMPIPLLCSHHQKGRVGWITLVRKSEQQVYVQASLDATGAARHAWDLVLDGTLRALSIGASAEDDFTVVDGAKFYENWSLSEVSLVRRGANPDAICEPLP